MKLQPAPPHIDATASKDDKPQWYIFVFHGKSRDAFLAIEKMNADIYAERHRTLPFFIPAHFIERHIVEEAPDEDFNDREAMRQAKLGNEIHSLFRHFVFIKTTLKQIYPYLREYPLLHFYRMASKPIYETEENMERFIQTCIDTKMHFALTPPLPDIRQNEKVMVKDGIWKNAVGRVVKVNMTTKEYTVAFECFGGTAHLCVSRFKAEDLVSENAHSVIRLTDENRYNFIAKWQRKVFAMTDHLTKGTLKASGTDYDNYLELANYGYLYFEKPAMQAKFYALMILCMTAY